MSEREVPEGFSNSKRMPPILIMTARDQEEDIRSGLDLGTDDY